METRRVLRAAGALFVTLLGASSLRAQVVGGNEPKAGTTSQDGFTVIDLKTPISGVDAWNDRIRAFQAWSSTGCRMMFKVWRPRPAPSVAVTYELVGASNEVTVYPGSLNTFPVDIPVANGDLIGFSTVELGLGALDYTVDADENAKDSLVYKYDVGTVVASEGNPLPHIRSIRALGVTSSAVPTDYSQSNYVPVVTRAPGTNGTLFRTEAQIYNPSTSDVTVAATFVPKGKDGSGGDAVSKTITVKAGETKEIADYVKDVFGLDGVTGISYLSSITRITTRWRIVNETPNGNFGQDVPGVLPSEALGYDPQALIVAGRGFDLIGAEETDARRTNLGLSNFSSTSELEVIVEPFDNTGKSLAAAKTYKVPKVSMIQLNRVITSEFGLPHGTKGVRFHVEPNDKSVRTRLYPYLSIIDNVSEDPIFVRGAKPPSL
jgi:hypothetical protein